MSDENQFMTVEKQSVPESYTGKFSYAIRSLLATLFNVVFLVGFISIIVGVLLTLLSTAAVLVAGLGAVGILFGVITLVAFSFSAGLSPHKYKFDFDGLEE